MLILGEKSEKFYIILKGTVSIMKPKEILINLYEEEYREYLYRLHEKKEFQLIEQLNIKNMKDYNKELGKDISKRPKLRKSLNIELYSSNKIDINEYIEQFNVRLMPETSNLKKGKERKEMYIYEYYIANTFYTGEVIGDIALNPKLVTRYNVIYIDNLQPSRKTKHISE